MLADLTYFPHTVDTVIPKDGKRLDEMYRFHKSHGIQARTMNIGRDENGCEIVQWCFSVPTIADFFKSKFG